MGVACASALFGGGQNRGGLAEVVVVIATGVLAGDLGEEVAGRLGGGAGGGREAGVRARSAGG